MDDTATYRTQHEMWRARALETLQLMLYIRDGVTILGWETEILHHCDTTTWHNEPVWQAAVSLLDDGIVTCHPGTYELTVDTERAPTVNTERIHLIEDFVNCEFCGGENIPGYVMAAFFKDTHTMQVLGQGCDSCSKKHFDFEG